MPVYVTDTHPLLWYASGAHHKLSRRALRVFKEASEAQVLVYVPAAALWEASIVIREGRVPLREPFAHWGSALLRQAGFDLAPLDLDVIVEASYLSFDNDPFDATIVATARLKDLPLITKDQAITEAGIVDIAW